MFRGSTGATVPGLLLSAFAEVGHCRVLARMNDAVELPVPVISVGNLTFGGTGKTPTVEYIARMLVQKGFRPGIVSRGYRGRLDRGNGYVEIVSDGESVRLDWEESGDEARLLALELLPAGVPVAVGRDRAEASFLLLDRHGVDIILLDDGFQYTRLRRGFDLVLIDAMMPFGRVDGNMGLLREPVSALVRADAILLTRTEAVDRDRVVEIRDRLHRLVENLPPVFTARTEVRRIGNVGNGHDEEPSFSGKRIVGFAGIGNPHGFAHTIRSLGCELASLIEFRDHHPYSGKDLERIDRRAHRLGADTIVTTSKDAIRLNGWTDRFSLPVYVIEIRIAIVNESSFTSMLTTRATNVEWAKVSGKPALRAQG